MTNVILNLDEYYKSFDLLSLYKQIQTRLYKKADKFMKDRINKKL